MKTTKATLGGLVAALILAFASPAFAQGWGVGVWGGDQRAWRQGDFARHAFDNGYRRGLLVGERDARSGRLVRFRNHREYRSGDWGFTVRFGARDRYRLAFRDGFEAGYRDAFRRHQRYAFGLSLRGRFRY